MKEGSTGWFIGLVVFLIAMMIFNFYLYIGWAEFGTAITAI
jgi:Mg/Co/Ni transporter MgtE